MVGNARFHCRGYSQGLVDAAEIVPSEVERQQSVKLFPLLREGIGQACESPHLHSHGQILTLDVRGANLLHVGFSENRNLFASDTLGRRVPGFTFGTGGIQFDQLCELYPLRPQAENNGSLFVAVFWE
jgi:hypothetical protein